MAGGLLYTQARAQELVWARSNTLFPRNAAAISGAIINSDDDGASQVSKLLAARVGSAAGVAINLKLYGLMNSPKPGI
jgi:hypothetical protein